MSRYSNGQLRMLSFSSHICEQTPLVSGMYLKSAPLPVHRFIPGPLEQFGGVRGAVLPGVGVPFPAGPGLCDGLPAGRAGQHRGSGGAEVHHTVR